MHFHLECCPGMTSWLALGLIFPVAAKAQDSASGAEQIRVSCEHALQSLASGAPAAEKVKGIVTMQQCGNSGIETLVSYWRRPAVDTTLLPALANVSAGLNDRRTYQAARAVALDPSRSESFRLAVGLGRNFHPPTRKAPQPVGAEARADVLSILKKLAASDPNERIRKVAAELGPLLQRRT